ncbi:MAG TPA: chlorite dismutase family protein [Elusimicrobiota bacterium]|jgi:chlorite dismutase|nr:chlorite dismutase family protein [Elusimicrobiota bacterium]
MTEHAAHAPQHAAPPKKEAPDMRERGGLKDGQPQLLDTRLFMQLLAFGDCKDPWSLVQYLEQAEIETVLYGDLNDPYGIAILAMSEDEGSFLTKFRSLLNLEPFAALRFKPELAMFGRTYALGHEPVLEDWLLKKPRRNVLDRAWPWAVWYPLRRKGEFSALSADEQKIILREHGTIGHAYGEAGLARDVRLACHGLDKSDNDFVIGLIGKRLHPLSAVVETMRKTVQTSRYIQQMGPFFVGKALWQAPLKGA